MKVRTIGGEFAGSTSAHGIPHVGSGNNTFLRIFWTIIVLACTGVSVWQISELVFQFLAYETDIETALLLDPHPFPMITVCNLNPYKREQAMADLKLRQLMIQYAKALEKLTDSDFNETKSGNQSITHQSQWVISQNQSIPDQTTPMPEMMTDQTHQSQWIIGQNQSIPDQTTPMAEMMTDEDLDEIAAYKKITVEQLLDDNDIDDFGQWLTQHNFSVLLDTVQDRTEIQNMVKNILIYLTTSNATGVRASSSYSMAEFIDNCVFNMTQCEPGDITPYDDPIYGRCYTFNNRSIPHLATRAGYTYGLKMLLVSNQSHYLDSTEMAGARVSIQSQGETPFLDVSGYNVAPGFSTMFSMQYEVRNYLPGYSECTDRNVMPDPYYYNAGSGSQYSFEACIRSYKQNKTIENCKCAYPHYAKPKEARYCGEMEKMDMEKVASEFACVERMLEEVSDAPDCNRPCVEYSYDPALSTAVWPGSYTPNKCSDFEYWEKIAPCPYRIPFNYTHTITDPNKCPDLYQNICKHFHAKNTMVIEVFFGSMAYQQISEVEAYPWFSFASDIGGQVGLWLGFSVITVCEFIALFFSLICCCWLKEPDD